MKLPEDIYIHVLQHPTKFLAEIIRTKNVMSIQNLKNY